MLPLQQPSMPDLSGKKILILQGDQDNVIPAESTRRLTRLLQDAGAEVTVIVVKAGHGLTPRDAAAASDWLTAATASEPAETA